MKKFLVILSLVVAQVAFAQTKGVFQMNTPATPATDKDITDNLNIPSGKTLTIENGGVLSAYSGMLGVRSSAAAFDLKVYNSEVLTANRALTLVVGNADRTLTLSGNPTLADWFDQSVKVAASPIFAAVTATTFTGALVGNSSTATILATGRTISMAGDVSWTSASFNGSGNVTGTSTLATVNASPGSFGSATQSLTATVNAKGLITALSAQTITPAVGSITGLGTGVATWLATPSGANLASALTTAIPNSALTGTGAITIASTSTSLGGSITLDTIDGLSSTGLIARTAANTRTVRTITGTAAEITVTNGDGVSANPTLSLPSALTFTGKTITGGTYTGAAFNGTVGATTPSAGSFTTLSSSGAATISGTVGIGTSALTFVGAYLSKTITGSTGQYGYLSSPTFDSGATSLGASVSVNFATAASAFTMANGHGIEVNTPSLGAGSAITTQAGVSIANQGATGITNAYGIDIAAQSGAATTNVGLRNAGTTLLTNATNATSSISGAVQIGNGSAATNVGIGGGNIYAGGTIKSSSDIYTGDGSALILNAGITQYITGTTADHAVKIYGNAGLGLTVKSDVTTVAGNFTVSGTGTSSFAGPLKVASYTVAGLPSASTSGAGSVALVTDATNAAGANIGSAPTGGGSVKRAVYSDGTNWLLL